MGDSANGAKSAGSCPRCVFGLVFENRRWKLADEEFAVPQAEPGEPRISFSTSMVRVPGSASTTLYGTSSQTSVMYLTSPSMPPPTAGP
ncbi:hypothetical protein ACFQ1I_20985 [Kitasatospora arboriphila]